jgi:hypothetical protein
MTILADREHIVFMKVGRHAGETFEEILARKRREYDDAGAIFWGYGGGTMHPTQKVQPFVRMHIDQGAGVRLVMQEMNSQHPATDVYATHFSADGLSWERIPKGINVRGSRYALVLDQIEEGDLLDLNLNKYRVGAGPSAGKSAGDYIRGRVDKGCLERVGPSDPTAGGISAEPKIVPVRFSAMLQAPYAVLLKTDPDT